MAFYIQSFRKILSIFIEKERKSQKKRACWRKGENNYKGLKFLWFKIFVINFDIFFYSERKNFKIFSFRDSKFLFYLKQKPFKRGSNNSLFFCTIQDKEYCVLYIKCVIN